MLLLTRQDVATLLTLDDCIPAVERAFAMHARGELPTPPGALGTHVPRGGYHVKAATLGGDPGYYAVKVNANYPGNPERTGLPTVQGILALYDLDTGRPLALLDSIEITTLRTAAASAVAVRYLARQGVDSLAVVGAGTQGRVHLRAIAKVRTLRRATVVDRDAARAGALATEMSAELGIPVTPTADLSAALAACDIWVTCTPARAPFIPHAALRPGVCITAVGADSPEKQELDPRILREAKVVPDLTAQAAVMGELHHAVEAGLMTPGEVHAELGQVIIGARPGRSSEEESFVFDSTGTALQDVASAAIVYERALQAGRGTRLSLAGE